MILAECLFDLSLKLKINNNVSFLKSVKNINKFYQNSEIMIISSRYEGSPNVALEAMANGLPIILSDRVSGALEFITDKENGLIFENENVEDLSLQMINLSIDRNLQKKYGTNGFKMVRKKLTKKSYTNWDYILSI